MAIVLGISNFFGVPFPLVLADRFFHIYGTPEGFSLDVFRWDEISRQPVYEVKEGKPQMDNINANPTGIITFTEPSAGYFFYKFRPKPDVMRIFGKIPSDKDFEVLINEHKIAVTVDGKESWSVLRNQFSGTLIGIQIGADGSIGKGLNWLPEGMLLLH